MECVFPLHLDKTCKGRGSIRTNEKKKNGKTTAGTMKNLGVNKILLEKKTHRIEAPPRVL